MYTTPTCSDCARSKRYLSDNGISFTEVDVSTDAGGLDVIRTLNDGRTSVPVVVFPDGSHVTEPTDAELGAKLAELG